MKLALITDTHFGARNDSQIFNEYFFKFWEQEFFPTILKKKIKKVIHLGDIFDRRKFSNIKTLNSFRERFIEWFEKNGVELHIIVGNHDIYYKDTNRVNTPKEILGNRYKKVKIYEEPEIVKFGKRKILFLPWINRDNNERTMELISSNESSVVMGHLELNGFKMHKDSFCNHGMNHTIFSSYDLVMTGHYHHKSTVGNVAYLGSTYEITWSDYQDPRGFHIFDTNTLDLEYYQNPHRIFHKIIYNDNGVQTLDDLNKDFEYCRNCYVKVLVEAKTNPYLFDKFIDSIQLHEPFDLSIIEDLNLSVEEEEIVNEAEDTVTTLNKYVDGLDVNVDVDRLKEILNSLHREAIDLQ